MYKFFLVPLFFLVPQIKPILSGSCMVVIVALRTVASCSACSVVPPPKLNLWQGRGLRSCPDCTNVLGLEALLAT